MDKLGNVYLAGDTNSGDVPLSFDAVQRTVQGFDAMIAKFNFQTCNPTVVLSNPVLTASSGTATLAITTDVPGCSGRLSTTSPWIQFNPSSGSGNRSVTMIVCCQLQSAVEAGDHRGEFTAYVRFPIRTNRLPIRLSSWRHGAFEQLRAPFASHPIFRLLVQLERDFHAKLAPHFIPAERRRIRYGQHPHRRECFFSGAHGQSECR